MRGRAERASRHSKKRSPARAFPERICVPNSSCSAATVCVRRSGGRLAPTCPHIILGRAHIRRRQTHGEAVKRKLRVRGRAPPPLSIRLAGVRHRPRTNVRTVAVCRMRPVSARDNGVRSKSAPFAGTVAEAYPVPVLLRQGEPGRVAPDSVPSSRLVPRLSVHATDAACGAKRARDGVDGFTNALAGMWNDAQERPTMADQMRRHRRGPPAVGCTRSRNRYGARAGRRVPLQLREVHRVAG
jgi:hypothetical protein